MNKILKIIFPAKHKDYYYELKNWLMKNPNKSTKAVYQVKSKTPVPRILTTDKNGILYIGEASDFKSRIGKLVNAMNGNEKESHKPGDNFHRLLSDVHKLEEVSIEVILTVDHKNVEMEMLQKYLNRFGELPPLNRLIVSQNE